MSVANPYNPLFSADEALPFVGREDVFSFFRQHLVGAPLTHGLVLIGRRGLGKTALLYHLQGQIDERYRLCLIPLAELDLSGEERLLAALTEAIYATLEAAGASTYRVPTWPETSPDGAPPDLRAWFRDEFLDVVMAALRLRHLLLAFDDAHLLFDALERGTWPQDFFAYWADLLGTYERLALVFALDAAYEDRILTLELLNNPTLHLRLAELPREDAERLIREPVEGVLQLDPQVVDGILALADGHPFLLHSVCRLLFRRSEERHHAGPVTLHDLAAIHDAALDQADEILRPLWQHLSQNEQFTLMALVSLDEQSPGEAFSFDALHGWLLGAGYAMGKTQLAAALRGLVYNGLTTVQEDTYSVPARLIADWVRANSRASQPAPPVRPARSVRPRWALLGLLSVLVLVMALGIAALAGWWEDTEKDTTPGTALPTATLSLNLEGTRRAEFASQTAQALPTATPTGTHTPSPTLSPTVTDTPPASATPRPMRTPRPTRTPITIAPTLAPVPTLTPGSASAATATLHPGG
ncbi:MAG: hypothetical protein Kow00106_21820 [Anaerolineae bacterium]